MVAKFGVWLPVSVEMMRDTGWNPEYGPPAPPTYGPELPSEVDRYQWALSQIDDLPEHVRGIVTGALEDAIWYDDHECG